MRASCYDMPFYVDATAIIRHAIYYADITIFFRVVVCLRCHVIAVTPVSMPFFACRHAAAHTCLFDSLIFIITPRLRYARCAVAMRHIDIDTRLDGASMPLSRCLMPLRYFADAR